VALDWITGESDQIAFQPGDTIPAGAFNASDHGFTVTASEDFVDSRLQDLLRSSTLSDEEYRPQWWHKISTWYVTLVLIAAGSGFAIWAGTDLTLALKVTISVLVVTCPCALGLATPLAEELVHFALRRRGVFIRKQSFLEKALTVKKILLDKTGTLTMGQLVLDGASSDALAALTDGQRAILSHMTSRSNHPVSSCLAGALKTAAPTGIPDFGASGEDLTEIPGSGLEFELPSGVWRLGRAGFALGAESSEKTTVFSLDQKPVTSFHLHEEFKADAAGEVARLSAQGYEIHLLSGDSQAKVDLAAHALKVPIDRAIGDLTPEAKAAKVRELDCRDTLMVGDGLNDSPSFEVAFCAATPAVDRPVLPGKADYFFLGDGIAAIGRSLTAARRLRRVVRDNLVLAVLYNFLAVGLCMAGLVTPVVAAILMPLSSISVVILTGIRLSGGKPEWI
jgi:Cu2+-exporting ATPase